MGGPGDGLCYKGDTTLPAPVQTANCHLLLKRPLLSLLQAAVRA